MENLKSKFDKIKLSKQVTNLIVGAGVARIISGIVVNNTAPRNVKDKICIVAAAFVIGGVFAEICSKYTDAMIDGVPVTWNEIKSALDNEETATESEPSEA